MITHQLSVDAATEIEIFIDYISAYRRNIAFVWYNMVDSMIPIQLMISIIKIWSFSIDLRCSLLFEFNQFHSTYRRHNAKQ